MVDADAGAHLMATVPMASPRGGVRTAFTTNGTVLALSLVLVVNVACLVGAGPLATPAFVGAAVVTAYSVSRTRPLVSAEFALWLWLLGPQVRRVIDQATVYHEPSPVLLAAPLASLVMLPRVRELRWLGLGRTVRPLLVVTLALAVGYAVGVSRLGLRPASAAVLVWVVPVLFGLQLVAVGHDVDEFRAMLDRVFVCGAFVLGVYGVFQFFFVPGWDAYWMNNAALSSIGTPDPFEIRVFSTLNSPGPMATFLTAAALYLTGVGHRLRLPAQVAAFAAVGLSLVRSSWLACVLGLAVVLAAGRSRAKATAIIALAVVAVGVLQLSGPVLTTITERIDETREGRQDDSVRERLDRYNTIVPLLADDTFGHGLGSAGGVNRVTAGGPGDISDLDSGLLAYAYALGLPIALLALGALTVGGLALAREGLRTGALSAGAVAGAMSVLVQMVGGNTLTGVAGVTFFAMWGLAVRELMAARATAAPRIGYAA